MVASVELIDAFLNAATGVEAPPVDPRMEQLRVFRQMQGDQLTCSPPGSLGGGVTWLRGTAELLERRTLSPMEKASVCFRMNMWRQRIPAEDGRVALHVEIQRLCEGVVFAQMHPLRILFLKANHFITALESMPEFRGKERTSNLLSEVRRYLALFIFYSESFLKRGERESFEIGKVYFQFVYSQLGLLRGESSSDEMTQLFQILEAIHCCLESEEACFPLLLQPLGTSEFSKMQIDSRMIAWTKRATRVFAANVRRYCDTVEKEFARIKKVSRSAGISRKEIAQFQLIYIEGLRGLRAVSERAYTGCDLSQTGTLMAALEKRPEDTLSLDRLIAVLDSAYRTGGELMEAFDRFHEETKDVVQTIAEKLDLLTFENPYDLLNSLCENHNACVWYPYQYMIIIAGGSLIKARDYWRAVKEKRVQLERRRLFSRPTSRVESQFVRGYQVMLHDLKEVVRRLHEASHSQPEKSQIYTMFSHLVTLEYSFKEIDQNRGKPDFNEGDMAFQLERRLVGLLAELEVIGKQSSNRAMVPIVLEAGRVCETMRDSLVLHVGGRPSLDALYACFARDGEGVELNTSTIRFFRSTLDTCVWTLREWNKRPFIAVGEHPFFVHLPPSERAHVDGYVRKIEQDTALLKGCYLRLEAVLAGIELGGRDHILEVAEVLERAEEFVSLLAVDEIYAEIMDACTCAVAQIGDAERKKRAEGDLERFRRDMHAFTDESLTFETDVMCPNRPLLAYASLQSLIESRRPQRGRDGAGRVTRESPLAELEASQEEAAPAHELVAPVAEVVTVARAAQVPLPLRLVRTLLERFVFVLKSRGTRDEAVLNIESYLILWNGLEGSQRDPTTMPYAYFDQCAFLSALIMEQLLKFLLSHDGISEEDAPLLFQHDCGVLLTALQGKRERLRGALNSDEWSRIVELGHHIVGESRELWHVETDLARSLRHLASLSSRLRSGKLARGEALCDIEAAREDGVRRIQGAFGVLIKVMEVCGFVIDHSAKSGEMAVAIDIPISNEGVRASLAQMERVHVLVADVRRDVRRIGTNGFSLESRRSVSMGTLRSRRQVTARALEGARYHLTYLDETLPSFGSLSSTHCMSMMTLTKGCLLVENLLTSLLAYFDIPSPGGGAGHILWHRGGDGQQRSLLRDHRLHRLYTTLKEHLAGGPRGAPLAPEDERALESLNYFIKSSRYFTAEHDPQAFAGSYVALKKGAEMTGEARLNLCMRMLSFLTKSFTQERDGLYTSYAQTVLSRLFPGAERDQWPKLIRAEVERIAEGVVYPHIHSLLNIAAGLLTFQQAQLTRSARS